MSASDDKVIAELEMMSFKEARQKVIAGHWGENPAPQRWLRQKEAELSDRRFRCATIIAVLTLIAAVVGVVVSAAI